MVEQPQIPGAWAKLKRDGAALQLTTWHSLADHGFDVAAVFEALLDLSTISDRLAQLAGRPLLPGDRARLTALVFLHDMGKANAAFWARQWPEANDRPAQVRYLKAGHVEEVGGLFASKAGRDAAVQELAGALHAWGAEEHFVASLSHHGAPVRERLEKACKQPQQWWQPLGDYRPLRELQGLLDRARESWPEAFEIDDPLPNVPRFVHAYAGLVTLADWIGSDTGHFPLASGRSQDRLGFARERAREVVGELGLAPETTRDALRRKAPDFATAFGLAPKQPNAMQRALADTPLEPLTVLEAETGSGKTEAALWHFKRLFEAERVDSLYFALPTRVAASQLHGRVQRAAKGLFGEGAPSTVLALPGYLKVDEIEGQRLPEYGVLWPDRPDERSVAERWAAERPKRFLAATLAVGTIDQALMAALQLSHAHLRAACLMRGLLVVDEVHASDTYMAALLERLLENHLAAGGHSLLLSATLGGATRERFLAIARAARTPRDPTPPEAEAATAPYPLISTPGRAVPIASDRPPKRAHLACRAEIAAPDAVAGRALAAAAEGARVLVVRNTVAGAIATQEALEVAAGEAGPLLFRCEGRAAPHHGRFARPDRGCLDRAIEESFGKDRPSAESGLVAVGSQTLEQSLDLDADLLIADLCPIDVLLQRIGRLHRHLERRRPTGFEDARVEVLVPAKRDLSAFLGKPDHGLGPFRDGRGVYNNLAAVEATWRLLEAEAVWEIPAANRRLVEAGTDPAALDRIMKDCGWEAHRLRTEGLWLADRQAAGAHALDTTETFSRVTFPDAEEKVRTRLGLDDRRLRLPEPRTSPFGQAMEELIVPNWMARGMPPEAEVFDTVLARDGGLDLMIGEKQFRYDRLGLRDAKSA